MAANEFACTHMLMVMPLHRSGRSFNLFVISQVTLHQDLNVRGSVQERRLPGSTHSRPNGSPSIVSFIFPLLKVWSGHPASLACVLAACDGLTALCGHPEIAERVVAAFSTPAVLSDVFERLLAELNREASAMAAVARLMCALCNASPELATLCVERSAIGWSLAVRVVRSVFLFPAVVLLARF